MTEKLDKQKIVKRHRKSTVMEKGKIEVEKKISKKERKQTIKRKLEKIDNKTKNTK